jgi:hypothetical protein
MKIQELHRVVLALCTKAEGEEISQQDLIEIIETYGLAQTLDKYLEVFFDGAKDKVERRLAIARLIYRIPEASQEFLCQG